MSIEELIELKKETEKQIEDLLKNIEKRSGITPQTTIKTSYNIDYTDYTVLIKLEL